jgi:hypothetical protein
MLEATRLPLSTQPRSPSGRREDEGEAMTMPPVGERRIAYPAPTSFTQASSPAVSPPPSAVSPEGPSLFAQLVRGLGHEVQRSETLVHQAIATARGGDLAPAELIALQAGVYRYSEAVDLASRLIDHATSGLKTVLQGQ